MPQGFLALILHAHLPYVRHPEHERFLEERWFFEAITETYIPILRMLERLEDDAVRYGLLISLSPTLLTMFEDGLLQERYAAYLRSLVRLADSEIERTAAEPRFNALARWYADMFRDTLYWYEHRYQRCLVAAFQRIAAYGNLELMTSAATHGFLPIIKDNPAAVRAQIHTATEYHQELFGVPPRGLWVPECAYYPGLEHELKHAGIRYFIVDSSGLDHAEQRPRLGVYAPCYTPNGVAIFARDKETSYQVWAAEVGYPGHGDYREFYRDIGFDLDEDRLSEFLINGNIRTNTGIKYFRITRDGERKDIYDPNLARERAAEHAANFMFNREKQVEFLCRELEQPPLIVSPYDAELFGHWWFEGPLFLEYVLRKICYDQQTVKTITPSAFLRQHPEQQVVQPAGSSWGKDSTYEYWVNPANDAILRDLHHAAHRLTELVTRADIRPGLCNLTGKSENAGAGSTPIEYRILQQMAREVMLAQASDWPFIMRTGTSPEYAAGRVKAHLARFYTLEAMLVSGDYDMEALQTIEYLDRIFPNIDPGWYTSALEEG